MDGSNPQEPRQVWFPGDDLFTPAEHRWGLPLGNLTSQYFANLYLSPFDHFVKEELGRAAYIRNVDDFVVFGSSKQEMWELKVRLEMRLQGLRLMLHPCKCHVSPSTSGISFLGQRVFCSHRHLRKGRLRCFLKKLEERTRAFIITQSSAEKLEQSLNSWRGHALQANAKGLLKKVALRLFSKTSCF